MRFKYINHVWIVTRGVWIHLRYHATCVLVSWKYNYFVYGFFCCCILYHDRLNRGKINVLTWIKIICLWREHHLSLCNLRWTKIKKHITFGLILVGIYIWAVEACTMRKYIYIFICLSTKAKGLLVLVWFECIDFEGGLTGGGG